MEKIEALHAELQAGLLSHAPSSGEYKYYAKQLATLQTGLQSLLQEAAIDVTELRLHALFYEAEGYRKDKENDHTSRLAEIETEASSLREELLARKPRPTRRLFPNLVTPQ